MSNIIFFGDSFASYGVGATLFKQVKTNDIDESYIDLVAHSMQSTPIYLGFGGTSWWYSYVRLKEWISTNPTMWEDTSAIVMCLTNSTRIKIADDVEFDKFAKNKMLVKDSQLLFREDFEKWAYIKFIQEVKQLSIDKKIILLPCFLDEIWMVEEFRNDVAVCALNLCAISYGEFVEGKEILNKDDIVKLVADDKRANHLSKENNRALAIDLVKKLRNYEPGVFMPTEKSYSKNNWFFEDQFTQARALYKKYAR